MPSSAALAALAAALVAAAPPGAGAPAASLRLTVAPDPVVLGRDASATVRVEGPAWAKDLALSASAGSFEALRQTGSGAWEARYVPPKLRLPLRAILAARATGPQGPVHGWISLALYGQGAADVKTRPNIEVTLRIGERTFGPVTSDENGHARVTVVAPPGVYEAWFGKQRHDLGLPEVPRLQAIVERREIACDAEQRLAVRVYEVSAEGVPAATPRAFLSVSRGALGPPRVVEPGVLEATWTVPPGPPGEIELLAAPGKDAPPACRVAVRALAGLARTLELSVDRERLVAGESVVVSALPRDAQGNPTRTALRAEHALGAAVPLEEQPTGGYRATVPVPGNLGGRSTLEIRVVGTGADQGLSASKTLPLSPAAVAQVVVATPTPAVRDGVTEGALRVQVQDRFGNPVPGPAPEHAEAAPLSLTPVAAGPGGWELRFVPARDELDAEVPVEVRAGEASAKVLQPLWGERARVAAAPRVGVLTNFGDVVAVDAGVQLELWPALLLRDLGWRVELGFVHHERGASDDALGFSSRQESYSALLGPEWRFQPAAGWRVWLFAGAGAALVNSRTSVAGGPVLGEHGVVATAQAAAGAGRRLGPGMPFVEARAAWFDDPRLDNLAGALLGGGLDCGYRFEW